MFRVSTVETQSERRLIVEGRLVAPWITELRQSWLRGEEGLDGRKLVIDLSNATVISPEGEAALLEMMKEGARFSCRGVLTKYVLKKLAHKCRGYVAKTVTRRSRRCK